MKKIRSLFQALAALSVVAGASGAMASDLPDAVFDRYVAAVHAADMAAVRAMISPDVERSDFVGCQPEMDNATCLLHYIETTVVKPRARMTERSRSVEGETLVADLEVRSPLYSQKGVERILGRDIVRVRDGRIVAFRFVPEFSDEPTAIFFGSLGIGPRAARPATKP